MGKKKSKKATILKVEEPSKQCAQCQRENKKMVIKVAPFLGGTEVLEHLRSQNPNILKCTQFFDKQGVRTPSFLVEFDNSEKSYNLLKIKKIKNILVSWETYADDSGNCDNCDHSSTCVKDIVPQEEIKKESLCLPTFEEMRQLWDTHKLIARICPLVNETDVLEYLQAQNSKILRCSHIMNKKHEPTSLFLVEIEKSEKISNVKKIKSIDCIRISWERYKNDEEQEENDNNSICSEPKESEQQLVKQVNKNKKNEVISSKNEINFPQQPTPTTDASPNTTMGCIKQFFSDVQILVKEIKELKEICDISKLIEMCCELKEKLHDEKDIFMQALILYSICEKYEKKK